MNGEVSLKGETSIYVEVSSEELRTRSKDRILFYNFPLITLPLMMKKPSQSSVCYLVYNIKILNLFLLYQ